MSDNDDRESDSDRDVNNEDEADYVNHPEPNVNVNRTPLHEFIATSRKYDGLTDANEFLDKFVHDCANNGYDSKWRIENFDRVLENDAKSWWTASYPNVKRNLRNANAIATFDAAWRNVKRGFLQMFDHRSQQTTYRKKNRELKFRIGDHPQSFVMKKLEILRNIDGDMRESRRVDELIRGLPMEIQTSMVLQDIGSCHEFLNKLRKLSEAYI